MKIAPHIYLALSLFPLPVVEKCNRTLSWYDKNISYIFSVITFPSAYGGKVQSNAKYIRNKTETHQQNMLIYTCFHVYLNIPISRIYLASLFVVTFPSACEGKVQSPTWTSIDVTFPSACEGKVKNHPAGPRKSQPIFKTHEYKDRTVII